MWKMNFYKYMYTMHTSIVLLLQPLYPTYIIFPISDFIALFHVSCAYDAVFPKML